MFKKFFGKRDRSRPATKQSDEQLEAWYTAKTVKMETALGASDERVLHVIVADPDTGPFNTMFFGNNVPGTGLATCQLARPDQSGPSNSTYRSYEMIIFTREHVGQGDDLSDVAGQSPAGLLRAAMNELAAYAFHASLEVGNTMEFPSDYDEYVGGRCFLIDAYAPESFDENFGLMLVIEIHRDEMAFAMEGHSKALLEKLKQAGVYPYSDLNRLSVLSAGAS